MKRRATGLLVAAAAVFLATRLLSPRYPWLRVVQAVAEASMVGGIADWFAVTALFRRPLGLPIPHTAIIPTRKDSIGRSLGNFVERHFLSREAVEPRLASLGLAQHVARWLSDPDNGRKVARHVAAGWAGASLVVRDEDFEAIINRALVARVHAVQVAPLLGTLLAFVTEGGRHQELLNVVLALVARTIEQNEDVIRQRVRAESPWWIPEQVDDKIHARIISGLKSTLQELSTNPNHPLRLRYDEAFGRFVSDLQRSPEANARLEALKNGLLEHAAVRQFSRSVWQDLRRSMAQAAGPQADGEPGAIERGVTALAQALLADAALLAKVDSWLVGAVVYAVEHGRSELGHIISHTVSQWDAQATTRKIELQIGSDLQYIRINGAVVGGLVGLVLYVLSAWF